jgi:hypothetical protein
MRKLQVASWAALRGANMQIHFLFHEWCDELAVCENTRQEEEKRKYGTKKSKKVYFFCY